jgi:nitroreductase
MTIEDFNNLIRERRSVFPKDYTGEKVDDSIVLQLLENANWAPTHKLTEPWRFKVFCGDGLNKYAAYQAKDYHDKFYGTEQFLQKKHHKLLNNPLKCSHIISIGMHREKVALIPAVEEVAAVACAVQNILLSIHAYGLGGYWTTGGVTYNANAKAFFELGVHDSLLGFIYLGVIDRLPDAGKRQPIEQKVIWCRA